MSPDEWDYLAVLEQKPGALRNGAPFKRWDLPASLQEIRTRLEAHFDGDPPVRRDIERRPSL